MTFIHWVQGEVSTNEHLGVETVEQYDKSRMGNITFNNSNGLCNKPCVFRKDEASMDEHLAVETVEQHEESRKGNRNFNDSNGLCNRTCSLTYQKKKKKTCDLRKLSMIWFGHYRACWSLFTLCQMELPKGRFFLSLFPLKVCGSIWFATRVTKVFYLFLEGL